MAAAPVGKTFISLNFRLYSVAGQIYNVEIYEMGYWESVLATDNLWEAIQEASFLCEGIPENRVRILDGEDKEI